MGLTFQKCIKCVMVPTVALLSLIVYGRVMRTGQSSYKKGVKEKIFSVYWYSCRYLHSRSMYLQSFPRAFAFPFFGTKNSNRHFLAVGAIQIVQCAEPWPSTANALNESSHNLGAPLLPGKSKSAAETE